MKVFGYSLLAAVLDTDLTILLLICYLYFVIGVQFGDKLGYIILAVVAGSFMGVAFGAMVGAVMKKREGIKIAVIIGLSMIFSFLSGLMFPAIKYIVARNVPILSYSTLPASSLMRSMRYTITTP
jgi:ABC-2 type transport system permease protein